MEELIDYFSINKKTLMRYILFCVMFYTLALVLSLGDSDGLAILIYSFGFILVVPGVLTYITFNREESPLACGNKKSGLLLMIYYGLVPLLVSIGLVSIIRVIAIATGSYFGTFLEFLLLNIASIPLILLALITVTLIKHKYVVYTYVLFGVLLYTVATIVLVFIYGIINIYFQYSLPTLAVSIIYFIIAPTVYLGILFRSEVKSNKV